MSNYISSNANRFYTALESAYRQAAPVTAANRFPAVKLQAHHALLPGKRHDKTGSRTFLGVSPDARRITAFDVRTYLTSWKGSGEPAYGPFFRAGLGAVPQLVTSLRVASTATAGEIQTTTPHGLTIGTAISYLGEIRFVTSVPDVSSLMVNAPFSNAPANGMLAPSITYKLATALPSLTLYDYWDSTNSVNRIVSGAAVETIEVTVNGDHHAFAFSGPAGDMLDAGSFVPGSAGLSIFPPEPGIEEFDYSIVPGHLGQVWLGSTPSAFLTLTAADVKVKNNIDLRSREFGSSYPAAIAPGAREIAVDFTLMAQDDAQTTSLYAAAKQRTFISAMLQLGQQQGQIMGIYLPNVIPEMPAYNDAETRLQWQFTNNLGQGVSNDEIYIAFA